MNVDLKLTITDLENEYLRSLDQTRYSLTAHLSGGCGVEYFVSKAAIRNVRDRSFLRDGIIDQIAGQIAGEVRRKVSARLREMLP